MKALGGLVIGLILICAFTGLQDVRANEADEAYKTGLKYYKGEGVKQDYTEAIKWFRKAADQGYAKAQLNIGWMYEKGEGVSQDYTEAMKWYRKAADQGDAEAQSNIGLMYEKGKGVTQDYAEAMKWYRKAADRGYQKAKELLKKLQ
jgi:TPR repeat protein